MKIKHVIGTFCLLLVLLSSASLPAQARPPIQEPTPLRVAQLVEQLKQETGDQIRISYHNETGQVRFIGTEPGQAIARARTLAPGAAPEDAALAFLDTYGPLFGLQDPARELTVKRQQKAEGDRSFVRWQQVYQGIPVLGGELIVQMDKSRNVVSANGEILPGLKLDTIPALSAEGARQVALAQIAKTYGLDVTGLVAGEPALWVYNPALLGGPGPRISTLVWRTEVTPVELAPIRELVLVDAQRGGVVLHFNQIDTARNRLTYTANNGLSLPGALLCSEGGTCTDPHAAAAHQYAGDTYTFYYNLHARDSINDAGMPLISTVHYDVNYDNAFWNGAQMVYGDAYGFPLADDVVAHELTHGVTQYESNLFYYYQSGALSEAFSDLWGELLDLYGSTTNDVGDARWAIGEDVSGMGALRNMQNPPLYYDPDRMQSGYYYTDPDDNGGVHYNCGVNNKAAYLLTDGGSFNGQTVTALGYQKVAQIYYEVQSHLLFSGADYADMYDLLYQSCQNLIGTGGIVAADCTEVRDATNAVEMNLQPVANYNTEAPLCDAGQMPNHLWFDNLENGSSTYWTFGALVGTNRWRLDTPPEWGTYARSGVHSLYANDWPEAVSDSYAAMKTSVALPANAYLHFAHAYGLEGPNYDGGVLEYSTNGGSTWVDAAGLFASGTNNPYDGAIAADFGNLLAGRQAFLDDSHGYIATRLNLSSLAGSSVRFRWRLGIDEGFYDMGWWVDDVRIYTCVTSSSAPAAPSGLAATAIGGIVSLTWADNSNNESGFLVERSDDGGGTWNEVARASYPAYTDRGLEPTTSYRYQVSAYNTVGYSAPTTPITTTTGPEVYLPLALRSYP